MSLRIAIAGATGRMGQALAAACARADDVNLVGATTRNGAPAGGARFAAPVFAGAAEACANADVWIDFSAPDATSAALAQLTHTPVRAAVIGTTGLSPAQEAEIGAAAARLAIVRAENFSLGVTLLAALVEQAAHRLDAGWDIEIIEAHHRGKADAPSGTALLLGRAAAAGRGATLDDVRAAPRAGLTGPRTPGQIGFSSVRAGAIVGTHDVILASEHEVIRLGHEALDRAVFAEGALAAARWAALRPPGLYSMRDVLGL